MNTTFTPVSPPERINLLDILRGFAIFGILMVNMQLFHQPMTIMLLGYTGSASTAGFLSEILIKIFFEGKFYVIFSMLFGYGFYLFINKQAPEGINIVPLFRRRVFFLLLFGILHVVLLWPGDILIFYALLGFTLPWFGKRSDRGLLKWAIWLSLVPVVLTFLFAGLFTVALSIPEAAGKMEQGMQESREHMQQLFLTMQQVYTSGSFAELVAARWTEWRTLLPGIIFFYPMVLAMFLVGTLAARKGLIRNPAEHQAFFRKALLVGLAIGLPVSILYFMGYVKGTGQSMNIFDALGVLGHVYGGFFLGLAYVSAIVLLTLKGKLRLFGRLMAPVGRMALTNYLMHSIICTTIFLPYGLGLFGKITTWQGILLTVVIFAVQIPLSSWWLSKFRYGPFEWLWRSLTYLKWQPFRIRS